MRWSAYAALLILTLSIQTALCPKLALAGARPDLVLVLVLLYASHAAYPAAVIAGAAAGLAAGLTSVEPAALFAVPYTAVTLGAFAVRDVLFVRHAVTAVMLALAAGGFCQLFWWGYHGAMAPAGGDVWRGLGRGAVGVIYTAALTPLVWGLLLRRPRLLGFPTSRYTFRTSQRTGAIDV